MEARFGGDHVLFEHKTAGVKQQRQIDIAVGHGVDGRAGVDAGEPFAQRRVIRRDIGFGQQNAIRVTNLRLRQRKLVHLLIGMHRIDQRNHAVEQISLAEDLMGEEGLNDRAGIGHAGALDHQPIKVEFATIEPVEQIQQRIFQLIRAATADATIGQGFDLRGAIANQLIVNGDLAELIFDNRNLIAVLCIEDVAQEGGFAGTEKAGQQGNCNRCHGLSFNNSGRRLCHRRRNAPVDARGKTLRRSYRAYRDGWFSYDQHSCHSPEYQSAFLPPAQGTFSPSLSYQTYAHPDIGNAGEGRARSGTGLRLMV